MKNRSFVPIALVLLGLVLLGSNVFGNEVLPCQCAPCPNCYSAWEVNETPAAVEVVFDGIQLIDGREQWGFLPPPNGRSFILRRSTLSLSYPCIDPINPKCNTCTGPNPGCSWSGYFDAGNGWIWRVTWRPFEELPPQAPGPSPYGFLELTLLVTGGLEYTYFYTPIDAPECSKFLQSKNVNNPDDWWNAAYGGTAEVNLPEDVDVQWSWIDCPSSCLSFLRDWCCVPYDAETVDYDATPCDDRGGSFSCSGNYVDLTLSTDGTEGGTIDLGNLSVGEEKSFNINLKGLQGIVGDPSPADLMFVLDRSGSMSAMVQQKSKLEIAKEALNKIYGYFKSAEGSGLPNSFKLGLASFNHEPQINYFLNYLTDPDFSSARLGYYEELGACGCTGIHAGLVRAVISNFYPGDLTNPNGRGLSCRTDPKVKEVVILASDGMQNRSISNQRNYRCPDIDYTGGGCVDEIWYPYGDRSELYNNFCDIDYHFGILPNGQIVQDDQKITFYTIGMGNPGTGQSLDSEWVAFLKDIAYNWGSKEGAYYHVPSVDKLYDIFKQIADIYINNKPANSAIVTVQLTDYFEFVRSNPLPTRIIADSKEYLITKETDIPANCVGCQIIWELPKGVEAGKTETINVTVKAVSGSGPVGVIETGAASNIQIFNKCGKSTLNLGAVTANMVSPSICTPASAPCCNADGTFKGAGEVCDSGTDYRCNGDCDGTLEKSPFTRSCSGSSADCPAAKTYTGWVSAQTCGSDERCNATAHSCDPDPSCAGPGAGNFRIADCAIAPDSAKPGGSVTASVEVINGGDEATATVVLSMNGVQVGSGSSPQIPKYGMDTLSISLGVPVDLEDGMYPVEVNIIGQPKQLCQTLTVFAARPVPVPELNELLLPLVACIVLAVVFFSGRKSAK